MPDVRLDNVEDKIDTLSSDWNALVIAAKAASTPRECLDLLEDELVLLRAQVTEIHGALLSLPTKEIAIDLNTPAD